jgi:hypothetical protein
VVFDASTGIPASTCVQADLTATIACVKIASSLMPRRAPLDVSQWSS